MADLTVLSPDFLRILQNVARDYKAGRLTASGAGVPQVSPTMPTPAPFRNDSGETIPAYGCMQVTDTEEVGSDNLLVVDKPDDADGTSGWYVFNGPWEVVEDDFGTAQLGPILRGYKSSGAITAGERWAPVSGQWYLAQVDGGIFAALGADDVADDVLKVMQTGGGGQQAGYALTPVGGIGGMTESSGVYTRGSATCDLFEEDSSQDLVDSGTNVTIYNTSSASIAGSTLITFVFDQYGKRIAVVEPC
mgnify:CR=1 FL=1